jgi:hypothetical protein
MARKEKKFHYIYKITNKKNGKYYIGMHSTDNLEDGYFGSGKLIRNSIRRHGKDSHSKVILEYLEDRKSLREREIELVNEDLLNDPMCMNLQPGGGGGFINEEHMKKCSSAGNEKLDILRKNDSEFNERFKKSVSISSKIALEKLKCEKPEKFENIINSGKNSFLNKKHSDDTKKRIGNSNSIHQKGEGNSQFGKKWIYNMEERRSIFIKENEINIYIDSGWKLGRKMEF